MEEMTSNKEALLQESQEESADLRKARTSMLKEINGLSEEKLQTFLDSLDKDEFDHVMAIAKNRLV